MKKILISALIVTLSMPAIAQDDAVTKYFSKYLDDETMTKVSVTSRMFSLFTDIETGDPEEEEFLEAIGDLKGLKVISGDSIEDGMSKYKAALSTVQGKGYDELMSVRDGGQNFEFLIKEKGSIISELLMISGGKTQFHILSLYGDIDLKKITKLASKMNIDALDHLKKIDPDENDN